MVTKSNLIFLGWLVASLFAAGGAAAQAQYGVSVPPINTFDRDQVVNLWRTVAIKPNATERFFTPGWTGNIAGCDPGTTSKPFQELVIRQMNAMRAMVGLTASMMDTDSKTKEEQAVALNTAANIRLSHHPDPTSKCYASILDAAAPRSLLTMGAILSPAVETLVDDSGTNNYFVGHRQGIFSLIFGYVGVGMIQGDFSFTAPYAQAIGGTGTPDIYPYLVPVFSAWPSAGYFPSPWLPSLSLRWNFLCEGCDLTGASVTMIANGAAIPVAIEAFAPLHQYDDSITFVVPQSLHYQVISKRQAAANYGIWVDPLDVPDLPVDITISNRKDTAGNALADISYRVTIINPEKSVGKSHAAVRYDGAWTTANEDGWYLDLALARTGVLSGSWFTFNQTGAPTWYSIGDGRWSSSTSFSGKIFKENSTPTGVVKSIVGGATFTFTSLNDATFAYTLNGVSRSKTISRSLIGPEAYDNGVHNCTDQWGWPGNVSGGVSIVQDWRTLRASLKTFDANGEPTWVRTDIGQWTKTGTFAGINFTSNLVQLTGTNPLDAWQPSQVASTPAGTASIVFDDQTRAVFTGTINGVPVSSPMVRLAQAQYRQGGALLAPSMRGGIDVDGQGKSQIVVRADTGQMQIGRYASGSFQFTAIADPGASFRILGAGDLDGSGKSSLLFQNITQGESGDVFTWKGFSPANQVFVRTVKRTWDVQVLADLDGDGKGDLVWRYVVPNSPDTGVSYIWFTDITSASPVNQVRKRGGAPLTWRLLGAADINEDGAQDMIYVSPTNQIRVLMATGTRTCANFAAGSIPAGWQVLKFADYTGSRRGGDILAVDPATNSAYLISLTSSGLVLPSPTANPDDRNASCTSTNTTLTTDITKIGQIDAGATYYASGDFDGNGVFDIVWKRADGSLALWMMQQAGAPVIVNNAGMAPAGLSPIPLQ